jgi:hypothetical protein
MACPHHLHVSRPQRGHLLYWSQTLVRCSTSQLLEGISDPTDAELVEAPYSKCPAPLRTVGYEESLGGILHRWNVAKIVLMSEGRFGGILHAFEQQPLQPFEQLVTVFSSCLQSSRSYPRLQVQEAMRLRSGVHALRGGIAVMTQGRGDRCRPFGTENEQWESKCATRTLAYWLLTILGSRVVWRR